MDEIKTNVPKTFTDRVGRKLIYFFVLAALVATAAAGYTFLPEAGTVSAQVSETKGGRVDADAPEVATQQMLDFALNLHSASEYSVYAQRGVVEKGTSTIKGNKGSALRSETGRKSTKELANAIDAMKQLPCTEMKSSDLTGKSFGPGVYCLNAAELNGEMTLDSAGNAAGEYVFKVAGSLNAKNGSSIRLENGAQGGNVFFVAEDATIGDNASFRANILTKGNISIGNGSTVTDKVMALGKVELEDSALLGGTTGTMEICKEQQLPVSAANNLSNRIFHFVVTGATGIGTAANPVKVAVGSCSDPFDVTAGPQTVTELNVGTLIDLPSDTFTGNFELVNVASLTPASTSTLGLVNLATRVANVNIIAGGVNTQLTLQFTNRRTITGYIEICKRAATGPGQFNLAGASPLSGGDPDVTGFFQYTIEGIYTVNQQNPNIKTLQIFTVPVGQCSGPIAVTKGGVEPQSDPRRSLAFVSEIPRAGFYLESIEVIRAGRRNGIDILGFVVGVNNTGGDVVSPAPGGGYADVIVPESTNTEDETLVVFANRSNPGRVKVCKIAGPGIPIDTLFTFTVTGFGATNAASPQAAIYGPVATTLTVRAGSPAQGGTCEFVPGFGANAPGYNQFQTFVNGTSVSVVENGISPNNTVPQNPGQLRAARIKQFGSSFTSTAIAGFGPNPDLTPSASYVARAAVFARAGVVEVEFTNFRFNPTLLKVCKIAGAPSLLGTDFTFSVALVSPVDGDGVPLFPAFTQPVTVTAGAAAQGGNCTFINGSGLPGGAFNQGSTITVIEAGTLTTTGVSSIICPMCGTGGMTADLQARRATLSGPNGLVAGVNSVIFTNIVSDICRDGRNVRHDEIKKTNFLRPECSRATRFDFDGDRKADPAVFTPSTGIWTVATSSDNYIHHTRGFGEATDKLVSADFDGDGKNDFAVWRPSTGQWFLQETANGGNFEYFNWGENGDIPQVGDWDGDGRSDFAVFRPSNGTWYIRTRTDEFRIFQFGIAADKPMAADYDGDGRTDAGIFRNGTWYTLESTRGFRITNFGQAGDIPVPNDYDGDGAADLAVYRGGTWFMLSATAYTVKQYGSATDIPVPADYNGDGKTDIAYFRPSTGIWHLGELIPGGIVPELTVALGTATDIPLQSPQY